MSSSKPSGTSDGVSGRAGKRRLLRLGALLLLLGAALAAFVAARGNRTFDIAVADLRASSEPRVIERGRHLFHGPAYCIGCHADPAQRAQLLAGVEVLPSGGWELSILPGTFRASNLTSDMATGVGGVTDAALARMLRHGVLRDGRLSVPIMEYQNLSDEDVVAILSYLRSLPAIVHDVPESQVGFLAKALIAFGALEPLAPRGGTPPSAVPVERTEAYGRYLAEDVANCTGCHTRRDMKSGRYVGAKLGGGFEFPDESHPEMLYVSPNITTGGVLRDVSREAFMERMRKGRVYPSSPMPWESFRNYTDLELEAVYLYLRSVPAAGGHTDAPHRPAS